MNSQISYPNWTVASLTQEKHNRDEEVNAKKTNEEQLVDSVAKKIAEPIIKKIFEELKISILTHDNNKKDLVDIWFEFEINTKRISLLDPTRDERQVKLRVEKIINDILFSFTSKSENSCLKYEVEFDPAHKYQAMDWDWYNIPDRLHVKIWLNEEIKTEINRSSKVITGS